jgi:hypothetical protein
MGINPFPLSLKQVPQDGSTGSVGGGFQIIESGLRLEGRDISWSWFDPAIGDVVVGWSRRGELDETGFVHFEAERRRAARSAHVYRDGEPQVQTYTFSGLSPLPLALQDHDGAPLLWIRVLLRRQ